MTNETTSEAISLLRKDFGQHDPALGTPVLGVSGLSFSSSLNLSHFLYQLPKAETNEELGLLLNHVEKKLGPIVKEWAAQMKAQEIGLWPLLSALTHSSFVHERPDFKFKSNECLEFLGDSVLNLLVSDLLYERYPHFSEGELSKARAGLVNEASLAALARSLEIHHVLLLGRGEWSESWESEKRNRPMADSIEALLAVIYKEQGLVKAKASFDAILKNYEKKTGNQFLSQERLFDFDVKTLLQELTMAKWRERPDYRVFEYGQNFICELWLQGKKMAQSVHQSKKKSERLAAAIALKKIEDLELKQGE